MSEHWAIGIFSALLVGALFFGSVLGGHLYTWFGTPAMGSNDLFAQNQALQAQLAELTYLKEALPSSARYKTALVYSRYPFNFKNELEIAAGRSEGVASGDIAVLPGDASSTNPVFIGKVSQVYAHSATVQTIFDPSFQAAVKIGAQGTDALLKGGSDPKLSMIPKNATTTPGDAVFAVSPNLPYGLVVGQVGRSLGISSQFFEESALTLGYDLNLLKYVALIHGAE